MIHLCAPLFYAAQGKICRSLFEPIALQSTAGFMSSARRLGVKALRYRCAPYPKGSALGRSRLRLRFRPRAVEGVGF